MLGKKSKPVIEMLTGSLISGSRSEMVAAATNSSSKIQFDPKSQSPKGLKSFDLGGVGLGIVAALEKSGDARTEIPASKPLFGRNLNKSNPIPVISPRNSSRTREKSTEEMEMESLEEYTIVTRRAPNKSYTKVYNSDGRKGDDRTPFRIQSNSNTKNSRSSVFHISPARCGDVGIPPSDFLSSCNLCRKKLHGKDIYMYRGEKAFCSTECRYSQIVMDERKEKCSSEASRPAVAVEVAGTSPYANGQMFTTGILAI